MERNIVRATEMMHWMTMRIRSLRLRTCAYAALCGILATTTLDLRAADPPTTEKPKVAGDKDDSAKQVAAKKAADKAAADEKKAAEAQKTADALKAAEAKKAAEVAKIAEAKRLADEAKRKADEAKRIADEAKRAEEKKKADEARMAREAQMKADAEAKAIAEAKLKAEADARAAAKVISDRAEAILRIKVSRSPDDVFRAVTRMNAGADKNLPEDERFLLYFQAGEWEKFRDLFAPFTDEQKERMYSRVVNEMTWSNPKALFLPTDVLRLADAAPAPLEDKQAVALGRILAYSIGKNDTRTELVAALKKGTVRLGGTDPKKRQAAARMLGSAEFWEEAKEFGLKGNDLPALVADAKVDRAAESAADAYDRFLAQVRDPSLSADERETALVGLQQQLVQLTPQALEAKLAALTRDASQAAVMWDVVGVIGRKTSRAQDNFDYDLRRVSLDVQATAMRLLAASRPLNVEPARTIANLYARNWLTEAQHTFVTFPDWKKSQPEYKSRHPHVPVESVLASTPQGAWLAVLEPQLSSSVKLLTARLTLMSDNIERLAPQLAEFAGRDKTTAAALADQYLTRRAELHNPNLTPEALRQYRADGLQIVLTRAEQDDSLRKLGAAIAKLDPATRALVNESLLVDAFDLCHSKAEPYTRDQIAQVFGPLEKVPASLLSSLLERMRKKLATSWRELSVQRDAATRRDADDIFILVDEGYAEGRKIADQWLVGHPDDWRINAAVGALLADWAEFAYFQSVARNDDAERFTTYLKRNKEALDRFRAGAKAYAASVPKLDRSQFSLFPYQAWFYGLLGISHDGGINLRKGVVRDQLLEVRDAMQKLPGGAGAVHLQMFSKMVADNVKANAIAPEMKFRYLSSAVEIAGKQETVYPAQEKVQYYESLLKEIRLRTRLDGSPAIRRNGEFGVFVTLVHTADLAREAGGFGKYLQNEVKNKATGRPEQLLYRDRFDEALRQGLDKFFDIKAIVFADPNAGARPMVPDEPASAGAKSATPPAATTPTDAKWLETPLAYLHLAAKDVAVDRVPPLEIELDFFDRDGRVVIPVPSPPILIEISDNAPARRAASAIKLTETVDGRELKPESNNRLKMDVVATSDGLVPDLDDLLDFQSYELKKLNVDPRAGLRVTEFHAGDDGLYAVSERNFTVELDPAPILHGANEKVEFRFPKPTSTELAVAYRSFKEMDPIPTSEVVVLKEGLEAAALARPKYGLWVSAIVGGICGIVAVLYVAARKKPQQAASGPPAYTMPREATPFAVVTLLHRIRTSPAATLSEAQRRELEREITSLERAAFSNGASHASTSELSQVADRWIKTALPT